MLREYEWVKGKKIETYQDVLDSTDGFIAFENNVQCSHCGIGFVKMSTEKETIDRLHKLVEEGYIFYKRDRKYREPIFSEKIDRMLDDILSQFAYDYSECEYHQEEMMEKLLNSLKKEFKIEVKENE